MLALSKDREHSARWQRAAELLLAQADVADFSKQVELALFFDAKLDVAAMAMKAELILKRAALTLGWYRCSDFGLWRLHSNVKKLNGQWDWESGQPDSFDTTNDDF